MSRRNHFNNLQKKGYKKRKYRNPFFEAKQKTKRSIKTFLIILITISVFTLAVCFFLRSPIYEIRQVFVTGTETIRPDEIQKIADDYLDEAIFIFNDQRNRFLFNQQGLVDRLSKSYSFETLQLSISSNSLNILLEEKTSQLLWISKELIYLVDLNGTVIRELTGEELALMNESWPPPENYGEEATNDIYLPPIKSMPKFRDLNNIEVRAGQQVLTEDEILNIFQFHEKLENLKISFFETKIDRLAGKWMGVQTNKGYDILFDATGNIDQQAKNLEIILRESIGERDDIQYIDLRFGDHVYYK